MSIREAVAAMGDGPLEEAKLRAHIWPLFSRALAFPSIYLANHSLGRPLDQVSEDVQEGLDLWYSRLDGAWDDDGWPSEIGAFRSRVAKLVGAGSARNIIPKTSAGQGLRAVLNSFDGVPRVVATRGEFDSIDLILKAYADKGRANVRWIEPSDLGWYEPDRVLDAVETDTDLLMISHIFFSSGQIMPDLAQIVRVAQSCGALVVVDAYHSAGVIPLDMREMNADFLIGGSYKYTRGGPGACWLAVQDDHLENRRTLDTGWFAKRAPFSYVRPDPPEYGEAWLESTPPVLTMYQARAGLELTLAIGVDRLRAYNLEQQAVLAGAFKERGVRYLDTDPALSGAFTLVPAEDAAGLSRQLALGGVITDARGGAVRFGPDLLNSVEELHEAARITQEVTQI